MEAETGEWGDHEQQSGRKGEKGEEEEEVRSQSCARQRLQALHQIALNPNLAPRAHTQRERMVFCSSSGSQGDWGPTRLGIQADW